MLPTPPRGIALLAVDQPGERTGDWARERAPDERALERVVVERVLAGERAVYRALVERHHRRVFAIVLRLTGSETEADDITQQAFVAAFGALGDFDTTLPFRSWINRIAVNLAKDHLKSKKRTETALPESVASDEGAFSGVLPDPERSATATERRVLLERALNALPFKDREVLVLKDLEEMSYEEMREVLGRPVTALKIRVVRARRKLRLLLEGLGVDHV